MDYLRPFRQRTIALLQDQSGFGRLLCNDIRRLICDYTHPPVAHLYVYCYDDYLLSPESHLEELLRYHSTDKTEIAEVVGQDQHMRLLTTNKMRIRDWLNLHPDFKPLALKLRPANLIHIEPLREPRPPSTYIVKDTRRFSTVLTFDALYGKPIPEIFDESSSHWAAIACCDGKRFVRPDDFTEMMDWFDLNPEFIEPAVRRNPHNLKHVKYIRQTSDLCRLAVQQEPTTLCWVRPDFRKDGGTFG